MAPLALEWGDPLLPGEQPAIHTAAASKAIDGTAMFRIAAPSASTGWSGSRDAPEGTAHGGIATHCRASNTEPVTVGGTRPGPRLPSS